MPEKEERGRHKLQMLFVRPESYEKEKDKKILSAFTAITIL